MEAPNVAAMKQVNSQSTTYFESISTRKVVKPILKFSPSIKAKNSEIKPLK